MKAWWAYWLTLGIGTFLWIGVTVVAGRDGLMRALDRPVWAAILISPIFLAGLNLVIFRGRHEAVCRLEVERHPRLSYFVGRGYSARTFALTGVSLLAFGVVIVVIRLGRFR